MDIMEKIECYNCGIVFGVSPRYKSNLQENKHTFYCPNGHTQSYVRSTADILKEKVEKLEGEISAKRTTISTQYDEISKLERKVKKLSKKSNGKQR